MASLIRLVAVAAVALTIVFICLWAYFRAAAREDLEKEWSAGDRTGTQDDHVAAGLPERMRKIRNRLILGVYVVPLSLLVALVYTPGE